MRKLERQNQEPEFMDAFPQNVSNSTTCSNPQAPFAKQRMDNRVNEWRLNSNERTHLEMDNTQRFHRRSQTHLQEKTFSTWHGGNLNVSIHANKELSHRTSEQRSICSLLPLCRTLLRYAPLALARRQIARSGVKTNIKSGTSLRSHTLRYTKPSSSDIYVQLTIACTVSKTAYPGMMTRSFTKYRGSSKSFTLKWRETVSNRRAHFWLWASLPLSGSHVAPIAPMEGLRCGPCHTLLQTASSHSSKDASSTAIAKRVLQPPSTLMNSHCSTPSLGLSRSKELLS